MALNDMILKMNNNNSTENLDWTRANWLAEISNDVESQQDGEIQEGMSGREGDSLLPALIGFFGGRETELVLDEKRWYNEIVWRKSIQDYFCFFFKRQLFLN